MNIRGSIVCPSRPIPVGNGFITGRKPGIVVYVKALSSRKFREFERFCEHRGIHRTHLQSLDDGTTAYECIGTVADLERLAEHPSIRDWHLIMSVRPPRFSDGVARDKETGVPQSPMPSAPKNVSAAAQRAARMRSMSRAERLAVEVREERRLMSAEERETLELAEANELPH